MGLRVRVGLRGGGECGDNGEVRVIIRVRVKVRANVTLRQTHSHLTFSNIDVDGHVGRFIGEEG